MVKGLFCGISKYRGNSELIFCQNDVIVLKEAFVNNFLVNNDDIEIIAEDGEIDNTQYIRKLRDFSEKCELDDLAVVYFTGHGGIDEQGDNYLCATNSFNESTRIYVDQLIHIFSQSKAKNKLIILDCCHADNKYGTGLKNFETEKVIEELYQVGISVFCSCKSEETSNPYYNGKISAFTQFLCDAINYKGIYREDGLYFNDIKLLVEVYARVWNNNTRLIQNPIFRTNMIGTIIFPLRHPKINEEKKKYNIHTKLFDIIDLEWETKKPKERYQKIFNAKIIANTDLEEKIVEFVDTVAGIIQGISLSATTRKQKITEGQLVEVVMLWIGNDILDVEEGYYKYRAIWEKEKDFYWCKTLGSDRKQQGNIAYKMDINYEQLKKDRLLYVYTDNELKEFWDKIITNLVKESEVIIYLFRNYENGETSFQYVQEETKKVKKALYGVYNEAFQARFPLPGSRLKELSNISNELHGILWELLMLLSSDEDEGYIVPNYKIKLKEYYQKLNRWNILMLK